MEWILVLCVLLVIFINPTIYEQSFARTLEPARLLILERLPTTSARETYL